MDSNDAVELLRKLGCQSIKISTKGAWVSSTCPLASWEHGGGIDRHPSFGISLHPNGESHWKCFTCGSDGTLQSLLWRIARHSGKDLSSLINWVSMKNQPSPSDLLRRLERSDYGWGSSPAREVAGVAISAGTSNKILRQVEEPTPLSEDELKKFDTLPDEVFKYLLDRKLTEQTIRKWELRWHPKARRIAIPIRDMKGRLVGISGRVFDPNYHPKFLHSSGFRRDFYLFGENHCTRGGVGYMVEGFFDVMFFDQHDLPAVGMMGSYLSDMQIEKCTQLFRAVVSVPDGDDPGLEAAERAKKHLGRRMPHLVAPIEMGKDPDQLSGVELDEIKVLGSGLLASLTTTNTLDNTTTA